MSHKILPAHGGYQKLLSFQKAEIVYDATLYFTRRFLSPKDRTIDQMVQAARSCKQNIAEASQASGTSKETEIKLTNIARASMEELLLDYRDFLRSRNISEWDKSHPFAQRLGMLIRKQNGTYIDFQKGIEHEDPAICSNVIIGLIKVTNYLLDQQIRRLEDDFINNGGLRESMTRVRLAVRNGQNRPNGPMDNRRNRPNGPN